VLGRWTLWLGPATDNKAQKSLARGVLEAGFGSLLIAVSGRV